MGARRVTSLDVAARAGVSQSAVSRVFSGASASKSTVDKVRRAAADLGYRPNVLARGLITGRSRIIGLVVSYLENPFYPDTLERLSHALQDRGYHVLVFMAQGPGRDLDRIIGDMLDHRVEGIIAASVGLGDALAERCRAEGIPVVLFNRGQDGRAVDQVTATNRASAARVGRFLVAGGHERIAMIGGWAGSSTGQDRALGFAEGLQEAGGALCAARDGEYDRDIAAQAARDLMAGPRPDAIFVANDHMAFGVMDALRHDLGCDVPGDVSVVGFDDVPMAAWLSYDLTTVRQPRARMVAATVERLLARIDGDDAPPGKIEIDGALVLRGSARRPEGWET